jgi:hypothetical protein
MVIIPSGQQMFNGVELNPTLHVHWAAQQRLMSGDGQFRCISYVCLYTYTAQHSVDCVSYIIIIRFYILLLYALLWRVFIPRLFILTWISGGCLRCPRAVSECARPSLRPPLSMPRIYIHETVYAFAAAALPVTAI